MSRRIGEYVRRQHLALLCLFLVVSGGTAYALEGSNTVFSDDIVNGEVRTADLGQAAVTTGKLAGDSVAANKVIDRTLSGDDVANNSLRSRQVAGLKGGDVADDTLTGSDVVESTLGKVNDADTVDTVDSKNLLKRPASAGVAFGADEMRWYAYEVNVLDEKSYFFGDDIAIVTNGQVNNFFICIDNVPAAYNAPWVAYVNGVRQSGTINDTTCTSVINPGSGGDLHIMSEGVQIFAFQRSFASQFWTFYGFAPGTD